MFRLTPLGRALVLPDWAHRINVALLWLLMAVPLLVHKLAALDWTLQWVGRLTRRKAAKEATMTHHREPYLIPSLPDALFYLWAVVYLSGHATRLLNRVAFAGWAAIFLAGCLVSLSRGIGAVWRLRRHAFDPIYSPIVPPDVRSQAGKYGK